MQTTRETIEAIFNGELPIERITPKPGQSKFYYIAPQGTNEYSPLSEEIKTIDIPEDYFAPQPVGSPVPAATGGVDDPNNWYSDALYFDNPEQRLMNETAIDIQEFENTIPHPYLDTKGFITTGAGMNVDKWKKFNRINWLVNGRPATEQEKRNGFERFEYLKNPNNFGGRQQYGQQIAAKRFKNESNLEINNDEINRLMKTHLRQDLQHTRNQFPDFAQFSRPLQKVLLDIQYNTGKLTKENWPRLYDAIGRKSITDIAEEIHRKDISNKRNDWARDQILSIESDW